MTSLNHKIISWFERGDIKKAIIGESEFFIPNITYRNIHDRVYIFKQLLLWSYSKNNWYDIRDLLLELIDDLHLLGKLSDVLDIFLSLALAFESDINHSDFFDLTLIENKLGDIVIKESKNFYLKEELRVKVILLAEKFSLFKKRIFP